MPAVSEDARQMWRLRIGRKRTVYLPRKVLDALGLREGDVIILTIQNNRIIIEPVRDPFLLAARRKKWASTTIEEFEEESEREQKQWFNELSYMFY